MKSGITITSIYKQFLVNGWTLISTFTLGKVCINLYIESQLFLFIRNNSVICVTFNSQNLSKVNCSLLSILCIIISGIILNCLKGVITLQILCFISLQNFKHIKLNLAQECCKHNSNKALKILPAFCDMNTISLLIAYPSKDILDI